MISKHCKNHLIMKELGSEFQALKTPIKILKIANKNIKYMDAIKDIILICHWFC